MKYNIFVSFLFLLLLTCDPAGSKVFYINNMLSYRIGVRITFPTATPTFEYDTVQSDSAKLIYSKSEIGNGARIKINGKELGRYFDTLQVYRNDTLIYCQCPTDANYWEESMVNNYETLTLKIDTVLLKQ